MMHCFRCGRGSRFPTVQNVRREHSENDGAQTEHRRSTEGELRFSYEKLRLMYLYPSIFLTKNATHPLCSVCAPSVLRLCSVVFAVLRCPALCMCGVRHGGARARLSNLSPVPRSQLCFVLWCVLGSGHTIHQNLCPYILDCQKSTTPTTSKTMHHSISPFKIQRPGNTLKTSKKPRTHPKL